MDFEQAKKLLADKMRERRKALGLTQEALGRIAGIHRTYIGGIEQCKRNPSLDNIVKIANVLEIEPKELFDSESRPR